MFEMIKRDIRDRKYSLLAYCVIALGLLWMYTALFPSIAASSKQLEKLFQAYPKGVFEAMGIQDLSFNTLEKFLGVEMFSIMWPILGILFGVSRAGNVLAGEIEKGTLGLYLSLPVSRMRIYLAKYASSLALISSFILVTILSIIPLAAIYGASVHPLRILGLALLSLLFVWAIFAVSFCLSAIFSERSRVYMIIGGLLVLMYAANVIASLKDSLSWLHHVSIFNYYNTQDILTKGKLHASAILLFTAIILVFSLIGARVFSNRDIAA